MLKVELGLALDDLINQTAPEKSRPAKSGQIRP
jgi:hypothetical protein